MKFGSIFQNDNGVFTGDFSHNFYLTDFFLQKIDANMKFGLYLGGFPSGHLALDKILPGHMLGKENLYRLVS